MVAKPLEEAEVTPAAPATLTLCASPAVISAVAEHEGQEHELSKYMIAGAAAVLSALPEEGERQAEKQEKGEERGEVLPQRRDEGMTGVGDNNPSAAATAVGLNTNQRGRGRGREKTGVATLLVVLAKADPSGGSIRALQRWAVEAVLPRRTVSGIDSVLASHGVFVDGKKADRMRWMRSCREVGEVIRLLVGALDEQEGEEVADGQRVQM